jgi:hypothetical protein
VPLRGSLLELADMTRALTVLSPLQAVWLGVLAGFIAALAIDMLSDARPAAASCNAIPAKDLEPGVEA